MPALLPARRWALTPPFHPCLIFPDVSTQEAIGGLLSVALSVGSPRPGVAWLTALRSPDFPLRSTAAAPWPTDRFYSKRLDHPPHNHSTGARVRYPREDIRQPLGEGMNAKQPYLVHETGGDRQIPLSEGMTFGRLSGNTLQLEDHGCSSRHAVIRREGDAWLIEDLGSTNGTWVNGERLASPRALKEGDRIQVGAQILRIEGLRVITTCARCGRTVPPEAAFCTGCGLPQRATAPGGTVVMAPPLPAAKAPSPQAPPPVPPLASTSAPPRLPPSLPASHPPSVPAPLPPSVPPPMPAQVPMPVPMAAPPPPFPTSAPVRKKKSGCWLAGCLVVLVLMLLAGVAAWLLWNRLSGAGSSTMP